MINLRASGLLYYLDPAWTDPNLAKPAINADDGQGILRISTGQLWVKQGGTWVAAGTFKGFSFTGAYNADTSYNINDVLTSDGSAYVVIAPTTGNAPPNATYYSLFAEKGDKGDTGDTGPAAWTAPAAWVTGTAYTAGPPASVVTQGGETYVCLTSNTAGTFATDLAAAKWIKVAAKGSGDLSSGNNLDDVADVDTALDNLRGVSFGAVQTLTDPQKLQARTNIDAAATSVVEQFFTSSGTYTPTTGMKSALIRCLGGGGAGGGVAGGTGVGASGGGGGAGSLSEILVDAADVGASKAVTIGAGGSPGAAGLSSGGAGGDTSFGTLCVGKGGSGGGPGNAGSSAGAPGAGGVEGTGTVKGTGALGGAGYNATIVSVLIASAAGGSSAYGSGGAGRITNGAGNAATGFGAGGGGALEVNNAANAAGGAGAAGMVHIIEFVQN
jgi:hypothetical protein